MIFIENLISLQRIDENLTLLLGTVNIQIRVCREISSGLYSWAVMSIGILGIAIYIMEFFANQYDCHINLFLILNYFNVDELRKIIMIQCLVW